MYLSTMNCEKKRLGDQIRSDTIVVLTINHAGYSFVMVQHLS